MTLRMTWPSWWLLPAARMREHLTLCHACRQYMPQQCSYCSYRRSDLAGNLQTRVLHMKQLCGSKVHGPALDQGFLQHYWQS